MLAPDFVPVFAFGGSTMALVISYIFGQAENSPLPADLTGWSITAAAFAIVGFYWRAERARSKATEEKVEKLTDIINDKVDISHQAEIEKEIAKVNIENLKSTIINLEKEIELLEESNDHLKINLNTLEKEKDELESLIEDLKTLKRNLNRSDDD